MGQNGTFRWSARLRRERLRDFSDSFSTKHFGVQGQEEEEPSCSSLDPLSSRPWARA
jgi:hypothetical protein